MNINKALQTYAKELNAFIYQERLPNQWFEEPDHIAIKAASASHFDILLQQIKKGPPRAEDIYEIPLDGRRIATAFLAGTLAVGSEWRVGIVEIMEPRPEKQGRDKVGLDHMEFVQPQFRSIEEGLSIRGIVPSFQRKAGHTTLNIIFGEGRHELKFTNKSLADVIAQEQQAASNDW